MTKVHTISFVVDKELISIEIYIADVRFGYWNIDDNRVVLNNTLYAQFRNCSSQKEQRKFFDQLRKVSQTLLA